MASESPATKRVMIIAGEASGDLHGAELIWAMRRMDGGIAFFGIGGKAMKRAGAKVTVNAESLSVVGITEVFSKLPQLLKGIAAAKDMLRQLKPDLLVLIDFPDFNLHVAATAKRLKIPVLYYISPQIWAWRSGRIHKIGRRVDHLAVILPFEEGFYRRRKIPATFVGHPLLDHPEIPDHPEKDFGGGNPVDRLSGQSGRSGKGHCYTVGLLPGSRDREVIRHLPAMLEAASLLHRRVPGIRFLVSIAPSLDTGLAEAILEKQRNGLPIERVYGGARHLFSRCHMAVAASGTVTLEAAIAGLPLVIIYKVSGSSYWMGRLLIRVKNISLVNLILGRTILPELIQEEASPERIAQEVEKILTVPGRLEGLRAALINIRHLLGGSGASHRVAQIALQMMRENP